MEDQEGLRQRKGSTSETENVKVTTTKSKQTSSITGEKVEKYILGMSDKIPEKFIQVKPYVIKAAPFVGKFVDFCIKMLPYVTLCYQKILEYKEKLTPYKLELLLPSFVGFVMCFFGGTFVTLIAAFEAYRLSAWESTYECIMHLYDDFKKVEAANRKDDETDDNNDGVADVLQISNEELVKRKVLLFLRTVDPHRVSNALSGINAGFLAVVATLKLQFAKAITLGKSIGDVLKKPANEFVVPVIEKLLPDEYKQWAKVLVIWTIDSITISMAWTLQRVISAYHSALVGGLLVSRNMLEYLWEMEIVKIKHEDTYIDEIVGYGMILIQIIIIL